MSRKENVCPRSFPSWSLFTLNYSHPEWLKSSASTNGEEFIRVVTFLAAIECNDGKLKTQNQKQSYCLFTFETQVKAALNNSLNIKTCQQIYGITEKIISLLLAENNPVYS